MTDQVAAGAGNAGPPRSDVPDRDSRGTPHLGTAVSLIGAVTSQAVLITALLYYFGWVYSHAYFGYFGVEVGMLGYSTSDYVLRSINAAAWPFVGTLFVAAGSIAIHRHLVLPASARVHGPRPRLVLRWAVFAVACVGVALVAVVGIEIMIRDDIESLPLSIMLMLSVGLIGYRGVLQAEHPDLRRAHRTTAAGTGSNPWIASSVLLVLGLFGFLWGVGLYADQDGRHDAVAAAAAHFVDKPAIVVLSKDRLGIDGTGERVGEITVPGEKFRYVYSGLWLLAYTADRYFLLPQQWMVARDRVFILRDTDDIRVDIARNLSRQALCAPGRPRPRRSADAARRTRLVSIRLPGRLPGS